MSCWTWRSLGDSIHRGWGLVMNSVQRGRGVVMDGKSEDDGLSGRKSENVSPKSGVAQHVYTTPTNSITPRDLASVAIKLLLRMKHQSVQSRYALR